MDYDDKKKYFVKDESLHNSDGDMFNYSDIANVLDDILCTNTPPYNVAIIGKWGLGKSSLINLVTCKYKNNPNYIIQEINAWKYEKESLRKVFLKQLWQGMDGKKAYSFETIKRNFADIINGDFNDSSKKERNKNNLVFLGILLVFFVLSIFAFVIYKCVHANIYNIDKCTAEFWGKVFLSYCKNIGTILFAPLILALLKILIDDFHSKQTKKIELNFPIETTDDYEMFLETRISDKIKTNPNLKVISVIDDLDRLSIDKIVEALDALKAFVGFERCIFIVPFDDEIIKRALDKKRTKVINDQADIIESEFVLDKLFQFRIYLPPILDLDIHKYAFDLVKQEVNDFIHDYCKESLMKKVVEKVLIYPGVSTPRQVKKLINAFINNYMIAHKRESSGKIKKGLLTNESGAMQIAVISVLQSDFNYFYDLLFKDYSCIEKVVSVHQGQSDYSILPNYLRKFFNQTKAEEGNVSCKLKSEYETLLNFLITTKKYMTGNIAPILFLAQDNICIKLGDETQRRTINALRSGNSNTVKDLLKEQSGVIDAIIHHLSVEDLEIENVIKVSISVFDVVDEIVQYSFAQRIIERVLEQPESDTSLLYGVPAANVLKIYDCGENKTFNSNFLSLYISSLYDDKNYKENKLLEQLGYIIDHFETLDVNSKTLLKKVIANYIKSDNVKAVELFKCTRYTMLDFFVEYYGIDWLTKLCEYIDADNDFSDNVLYNLKKTFMILIGYFNPDEIVNKIYELIKYTNLFETIAELFEIPIGGKKFKESISVEKSTEILNALVLNDYDECGENICRILNDLPFEITNSNSEVVDNFTINFASSYDFDDILLYCAEKNYLSYLPNTITKLIDVVFTTVENDDLFNNLIPHFTEEQKEKFFTKLGEHSKYKDKKDYNRELTIFKSLSVDKKYSDELTEMVSSIFIPQFNSYYNRDSYFTFISEAMSVIYKVISTETIDLYINALLTRISSSKTLCLKAMSLIPNGMSEGMFKKVFDKIIVETQQSEWDTILDIIFDNNEYIKNDEQALLDFIIQCLLTTNKPEKALSLLCNKFTHFTDLDVIVENAIENLNCEEHLAENALVQIFNNSLSIGEIADAIIKISAINKTEALLSNTLKKISNINITELFANMYNKLNTSLSDIALINIVNLTRHYSRNSSAIATVLKCLELSLQQINMVETSKIIIREINDRKDDFKNDKNELARVLREGFVSSSSDSQKELILQLVTSIRIKPQFKKTLSGEALKFYNKWIH